MDPFIVKLPRYNGPGLWGHKNHGLNTSSAFFFLVALGLCCCAQAFSSYGERGLLFVAVRGLLTVVASLVAEHGL